jgi:hypothetical protein
MKAMNCMMDVQSRYWITREEREHYMRRGNAIVHRDYNSARTNLPDSFLFHSVRVGSGVHSDTYKMGTAGSLPGNKAAGELN